MDVMGTELSPGMKCIKYLMVAFNTIFVMTAILIIVAGTTIHAMYYNFDEFLTSSFFSPATLLIVVGAFIFFIALFGVVGAARESTCMVNMFALMLGFIFILELSAAIAAFAFQGSVSSTIGENMLDQIQHCYVRDPEVRRTVDFIQEELGCCGSYAPEDWLGVLNLETNPEQFNSSLWNSTVLLPDSCCADVVDAQTGCSEDALLVEGCVNRLAFIVRQSATLLAAAALTVSMIQIVGVYFAWCLSKAIRLAKSARTRRQHEIRSDLLNSYSLMHPEHGTGKTGKSVFITTAADSTA